MFDAIYLTGASGFIGEHLLKRLARLGLPIYCLGRQAASNSGQTHDLCNIKFIEVDLTNLESLRKILSKPQKCLFIHLAGVGLRRLRESPNFNISSTNALSEVFLERGTTGSRFIFASSIKAIKPMLNGTEISVNCPYGISKQRCEKLLLSKFSTHSEIGLSILRIPAVFGPGDENLKPLFRMSQKGIFIFLSKSLDRPLPIIFVDDLVDEILKSRFETERTVKRIVGSLVRWNNFVSEIMGSTHKKYNFRITIYAPPILICKKLLDFFNCTTISQRISDICFNEWPMLPLETTPKDLLAKKVEITVKSYL